MKKTWILKKPLVHGLLILWMAITCLQPVSSIAATPARVQPEKDSRITVLNIALFYAGLIGVVIGATTGWVTLLFESFDRKGTFAPADEPAKADGMEKSK